MQYYQELNSHPACEVALQHAKQHVVVKLEKLSQIMLELCRHWLML
jgi:hypothetical protein